MKKDIVDTMNFFFFLVGIVMGTQVATVQIMFNSLQHVLPELPKLLHAAHNYNLIVELILEFLSTAAHQMLVFLSQVKYFSSLSTWISTWLTWIRKITVLKLEH